MTGRLDPTRLDSSRLAARYIETLERRDWEAFAALLHPDVVYRLPQTGELVKGRDRFVRFNREYPGEWHLTARLTVNQDDAAVAWVAWTLGDTGEAGDAIVFLEYDEQKLITSVTDFWPKPYDADQSPASRAAAFFMLCRLSSSPKTEIALV